MPERTEQDEAAQRWGGALPTEPLHPREEAELRHWHYNVSPRNAAWHRYSRLFATLDHERRKESGDA